jgi:GT2 family glycosyltransferase
MNASNPAISIIIPTFNRHEQLQKCLDALLPQVKSGEETEIIVVDDGSAENVHRQNDHFCRTCGVRYIHNEHNRGMAVGRNRGWRAARNAWIAFIDDDISVAADWHTALMEIVPSLPRNVIGIEGRVCPEGDGIWDREVRNLSGNLFLTCHFIVRRDALEKCGGFDETFERLGPFCEDHELAVRLRKTGTIIFAPSLLAVHQAKRVDLLRLFINSGKRIRKLLNSELYFYSKHPRDYCRYRHSPTFWGTYFTVVTRQAYINARRRTVRQILSHPLQAVVMIAAGLYEQVAAISALPSLLKLQKAFAGSRSAEGTAP